MNKITLSLLTAGLLQTIVAKEVQLEPLEVTSTAIKTDELKSTDAVEIYTAEDIEKAHVQNVYEFLNQNTSVITAPGYGNPFTQKIDMRGYGIGDGYQNTVITINGRKMNNVDMVPQLLGTISPDSIKRIEIIKSSGIVTGGDGANAGVINITTKQSNEKEVTLYGGTYNTKDASFYLGHKTDTLSISANAEAQSNGGIRHVTLNNDKDQSKLATGTLNLAYTPIEELELRAGASFARTDVFYAGYLTKNEYEKDPTQATTLGYESHQKYDTDTMSLGASYFINEQMSVNVDGNHEKKKSQYVPYSPAYYTYDSAKASFDYENDLLFLTIGADIFNGERDGYGSKTSKNNLAGYIMSRFNLSNSTIKAGYRYETVSYEYRATGPSLKEDHQLNGAELGYNYTIDSENSLYANYSHSYQAPDIDRFFSTTYPPPTYTPVVSFNGFIDPMQANNYTLGYNNLQASNKFKISLFYIDLKNEIYLSPDPSGFTYGTNTNIDKSHKYGLDIYDKWLITPKWNLALNYNYVQAIIDDEVSNYGEDYSGNKLPGVSDHNVKATIHYLPSQFTTLGLTQVYRSEAYAANDFNNNFSQKQDAYMSTDISVTYSRDTYEVFAKINNLFNQKNGLWIKDDVIYPINFTTTAIAGLKLKF